MPKISALEPRICGICHQDSSDFPELIYHPNQWLFWGEPNRKAPSGGWLKEAMKTQNLGLATKIAILIFTKNDIGKSYGAAKFWDSLFLDYLYRLFLDFLDFLVPTSRPLSAPKKKSTSCPWPLGQIPGSLGLRQTPCAPKKVQPALAAVERWVPSKWEVQQMWGLRLVLNHDWLVVWNMNFMTFHSVGNVMECHHPNWRSHIYHIFQRGRLKPPNSLVLKTMKGGPYVDLGTPVWPVVWNDVTSAPWRSSM